MMQFFGFKNIHIQKSHNYVSQKPYIKKASSMLECRQSIFFKSKVDVSEYILRDLLFSEKINLFHVTYFLYMYVVWRQ